MCKAIIQIQDEAKAEGEKQGFDRGEKQGFDRGEKQGFDRGEKQGFAKGEKQGIEKGVFLSVKNLMESRKWTALEAMDALRVPEEDRAHYMAML